MIPNLDQMSSNRHGFQCHLDLGTFLSLSSNVVLCDKQSLFSFFIKKNKINFLTNKKIDNLPGSSIRKLPF